MSSSAAPVGPLGEVTCVAGQTFCLSATDGQLRPGGDHGVYLRDVRMLSGLVLRIDGRQPHGLGGGPQGPGTARFSACVLTNDHADPALLVERTRRVGDGLEERIRIVNHSVATVAVEIRVEAEADFAYVFDVKHGRRLEARMGSPRHDGLHFADDGGREHADLRAVPSPDRSLPGALAWQVELPTQTAWTLDLVLASHGADDAEDDADPPAPARAGASAGPRVATVLPALGVTCSDERFEQLVARSVADLESLVVHDGDERWFAAGTPWYLTLFGRDALWTSVMTLPLGTDLAADCLRALARRQGTAFDEVTEEQPGKILHEVRHGTLVARGDLPPQYYGSIDATPLFVVALERAWRWGLDPGTVAELLPHAERALAWLRDHGDADGDGLLEYAATGPRRLANQGWKDSGDSVFFGDGSLAEAPIALCEVQAYAYRAATAGAALLDAFGRPGAAAWTAWADRLRTRFRDAYWVERDGRRFPAIALDGRKRPVDSLTSNIGHLLGTGLLDDDEEATVAARLAEPDLDSGWGLRTASSMSPRFNPLAYHGGSVWPHDTAIAIDGLARAGADDAAGHLLLGLVAAASRFDHRLPELFGGEQRTRGSHPLPYPSACRPQAWAAGAALLALRALLGLEPDVPNGVVRLRALRPLPFAQLAVEGMPLAGGRLSVLVDGRGVTVTECPPQLEVLVG